MRAAGKLDMRTGGKEGKKTVRNEDRRTGG